MSLPILLGLLVLGCSSAAPPEDSVMSGGKRVTLLPGEACLTPVGCGAPVLEVAHGGMVETTYYAALPISVHSGSLKFELSTTNDYWSIIPAYATGDHVVTIYVTGESRQVVLRFR